MWWGGAGSARLSMENTVRLAQLLTTSLRASGEGPAMKSIRACVRPALRAGGLAVFLAAITGHPVVERRPDQDAAQCLARFSGGRAGGLARPGLQAGTPAEPPRRSTGCGAHDPREGPDQPGTI
jgi:hypothetical protein